MILNLQDLTAIEKQYYLQHVIAPRPICFASTIDNEGNANLSPFSFFNMFSSNPPVVIFSPARRVRDNTTKHTLQNVLEVPEVVINIVTYDVVQQASLSSCDYPKGVDEFSKAGFTKQPATMVKPPMVKECKVKLECKVKEVKPLGTEGGAGNLVICEVLCMHIDDSLLNENKKFDQAKLDLVARLGGDWYCRVSPDNLFTVPKPNIKLGIGIDNLPQEIKSSKILTGNHLGKLANVEVMPGINEVILDNETESDLASFSGENISGKMHELAAKLLDENKVNEAWQLLLRK